MKILDKYIALIIVLIMCIGCGQLIYADVIDETQYKIEKEERTEKKSVRELDLGDYVDEMIVGERQLLEVTVIPLDAVDTEVNFYSTNEDIATINGMGRITAVAVGNTTITAECGGKKSSFLLNVKEVYNKQMPVTDIEISEYEEEFNVGDTVYLNATVVPSDASEKDVNYTSSDTDIAVVNSSGEVKGVSPGVVKIYVNAGDITKEVLLTVNVKTTSIELNKDYLVLKEGETYQLIAKALPEGAKQNIVYRSLDSEIANVNSTGKVMAKNTGNTVIIVSNGDSTVTVSIIVNRTSPQVEYVQQDGGMNAEEKNTIYYPKIIKVSDVGIIESEVLRKLYDDKGIIEVIGDGYSIEIAGNNILNYNNLFYTDILLKETKQGYEFCLNGGKPMCGSITLCLDDKLGKNIYLYNNSKEKYERIETDDLSKIELSVAGEYLITSRKIDESFIVSRYITIVVVAFTIIAGGVYVALKKKYWFW